MSNFERERNARIKIERITAQMERELQSKQDYVRDAQEFMQVQNYQQLLSEMP